VGRARFRKAGRRTCVKRGAKVGTSMKTLALDIEISNVFDLRPGEDINKYAPFDVAVAATQVAGGEERLWCSRDAEGSPQPRMNRENARQLLNYLEQMQRDGIKVCAWNGLSFDLRWIARAADDVKTASRVARAMYDPMFQFFKLKGFPVGLEAVAKGLGLSARKSMNAADAPKYWAAGEHQRVFDYVLGDVRMTTEIVRVIGERREFAWLTQRGELRREKLARLKSVEECLNDPLPDQSWMKTPIRQEVFTGWMSS
jgi:hypothetical protein